jgi:hypothetical protein
MNKRDLKRLGALWKLENTLHNEWVDAGYTEELQSKIEVVHKVKKQLEEQKRGFLKSKIPYALMADFIVDNISLSTLELKQGLMDLFLKTRA